MHMKSSIPAKIKYTSALHLFRSLIPAWKFFVQIETIPYLEYRIQLPHGFSPWQSAIDVPKRTALHFFINPQGNSLLAMHSLLERWEQEEFSDNNVSFELIRNFVEILIKQKFQVLGELSQSIHFQFRVTRTLHQSHDVNELFVSDIKGLSI